MNYVKKYVYKRSSKLNSKIKHSAQFKFNLVLESFKQSEVTALARKHNLAPNQISTWRRHFLDNGPSIFELKADKTTEQAKQQIRDLESLLGKKEVEINLLKNFLDSQG